MNLSFTKQANIVSHLMCPLGVAGASPPDIGILFCMSIKLHNLDQSEISIIMCQPNTD